MLASNKKKPSLLIKNFEIKSVNAQDSSKTSLNKEMDNNKLFDYRMQKLD